MFLFYFSELIDFSKVKPVLSYQKDKLSLKKRQYKAALDIGYLKKL
jgi:hypothetical protein